METALVTKDVQQGNLNYQKVKLFLEHNSNQKPCLTSKIVPTQLLRQYMNDDDFTIYYEGEIVFKNEVYAEKLNQLYFFWKEGAKQEADIDDFIKCWVKGEEQLQVEYSLFDQLQKKRKEEAAHLKAINESSKTDKIKEDESVFLSLMGTKNHEDNELVSMGLLQHFYSHFCKKQVIRLSNSTFDQYQQFYNQMNLTKWMQYTRDIGLGNFQKIYPNRKLKQTFIKFENSRKCLTFQAFKEALLSVLGAIFQDHPQDITTQRYELLGIRNLDNFNNKFRQLGLLPPPISKAKLLKKSNPVKTTSRSLNRQNIINSSISIHSIEDLSISSTAKLANQNKIKTPPQKGIAPTPGQSKRSMVDGAQIEQTQGKSEVRGSAMRSENNSHLSSIGGRLGLRAKVKDQTFKEMFKEEEEDPYLRRYNNKENINAYHSLIHRIDQRVEKMCIKY